MKCPKNGGDNDDNEKFIRDTMLQLKDRKDDGEGAITSEGLFLKQPIEKDDASNSLETFVNGITYCVKESKESEETSNK